MSLHENGFELLRGFITPPQLAIIQQALSEQPQLPTAAGVRDADQLIPAINKLINSPELLQKASSYLSAPARPVRTIFFNKTAATNWLVSWHQDKTICLNQVFEKAGWGPWSIKNGSHHVQPPFEILQQMVTFRIHLDDTDTRNGCLKVIPKSHNHGLLSATQIHELVAQNRVHNCIASAGDLLVMRPYLLHSSSKATHNKSRRIIHIEYASFSLDQIRNP